jgi:hypothetical protein
MQTYSGRCRGGPKDGEDLISTMRRVEWAKSPPISLRTAFSDTPLPPAKIEWGTYDYILGQWCWHAHR